MRCFVVCDYLLSAALHLLKFWFVNYSGVVEEFVGLTLREGMWKWWSGEGSQRGRREDAKYRLELGGFG
jgi:hypothetical protein